MNIKPICKAVVDGAKKHSPEILTAVGVAGMIAAIIEAVRETPRAVEKIKADSRVAHDGNPDAYTKKEAVKSAWRYYVPAVVLTVTSSACIFGGASINLKRNAALMAAYTMSDTALKQYKEQVRETLGNNAEKKVLDAAAKKEIEAIPVSKSCVIDTGKGTTLCYDKVFGRYFHSDIVAIKKAMVEVNREIVTHNYAALNDFYDLLGLPPVDMGDELGWNLDDGPIEINFSAQIAENGQPCIVMEYNELPKPKFYHY